MSKQGKKKINNNTCHKISTDVFFFLVYTTNSKYEFDQIIVLI